MHSDSIQSLLQETLRSLRGGLSQEQVNRRLGKGSNYIARWESGHSAITWEDFCHLCKALKVPLSEIVKSNLYYQGSLTDTASFLRFISGFTSHKKLAATLGISASQVSRIFAGQTPLKLLSVFELINREKGRLTEFVTELAPNLHNPGLLSHKGLMDAEKNLHFKYPWIGALVLFMRTRSYNESPAHSNSFFAKNLGVSEELVASVIDEMVHAKILRKDETHYHPLISHLDTGGSFEGSCRLRIYWLEQCISWVEKSKPDRTHYFGYKLFNVPKNFRPQLEDFYMRTYKELEALLHADKEAPAEEVYLFACQIKNLSDE